jgi:hypothetical protein
MPVGNPRAGKETVTVSTAEGKMRFSLTSIMRNM